jgi:uncharacterized protein (DUF1786 family)
MYRTDIVFTEAKDEWSGYKTIKRDKEGVTVDVAVFDPDDPKLETYMAAVQEHGYTPQVIPLESGMRPEQIREKLRFHPLACQYVPFFSPLVETLIGIDREKAFLALTEIQK